MPFIYYNPNPGGKRVGDCVIRALSKSLNQPWIVTFLEVTKKGIEMCDMPSSNAVWGGVFER